MIDTTDEFHFASCDVLRSSKQICANRGGVIGMGCTPYVEIILKHDFHSRLYERDFNLRDVDLNNIADSQIGSIQVRLLCMSIIPGSAVLITVKLLVWRSVSLQRKNRAFKRKFLCVRESLPFALAELEARVPELYI
jgi:hypothetical protein